MVTVHVFRVIHCNEEVCPSTVSTVSLFSYSIFEQRCHENLKLSLLVMSIYPKPLHTGKHILLDKDMPHCNRFSHKRMVKGSRINASARTARFCQCSNKEYTVEATRINHSGAYDLCQAKQ